MTTLEKIENIVRNSNLKGSLRPLKKLGDGKLTKIVKRAIPNLSTEGVYVWAGTISEERLSKVLHTIQGGNYIQEAISLLSEKDKMRESITYSILPPGPDATVFRVLRIDKKNPLQTVYLGNVITYSSGEEVRQFAISNMRLINSS